MPRRNMPTAASAVNTAHGKTSYLSVAVRRNDLPANLGIVSPVSDLNNAGLTFTATATLIGNNRKRARVKLVAINPPGGGVTPGDGILSITLSDVDTGDPLPVTETPVDYVDDPTAP